MVKPRDRVISELEPLEPRMRELGFALERSPKIRFVHQTGPRTKLGSRWFWITFHVGFRPEVRFDASWAVYARLREDVSEMSAILSAFSDRIPGWTSYLYPDNTIASADFRVDTPDYATHVRPLLRENLLLGARFLLAHGDCRRAAEFAVSQGNVVALLRAFDLYVYLADYAAAREVAEIAARNPEAASPHFLPQWAARRELLPA